MMHQPFSFNRWCGNGIDTALETAGVALMFDDLSKLPYTIKLSRKLSSKTLPSL